MPFYECVFIARQDISANDADKIADNLSKIITDNGGKITKRENWGLRLLAYRINKNRKGHYVLLEMDTPFEAVKEMERQMGINEDILRFMTIKLEALSEGPSPMMAKNKDSSEDDSEGFGFHPAFAETAEQEV